MGYFYTDSSGKEQYKWDAVDEQMSNSYRGPDRKIRTVFNTPGSEIGNDIFDRRTGEKVTPASTNTPTVTNNGYTYNALEGFTFPSARRDLIESLRRNNRTPTANQSTPLDSLSGNISLSQLAGNYLSGLSSNTELRNSLESLFNNSSSVSAQDLDPLLQSYWNYTGSGRQGSGTSLLSELLFNNDGNVMLNPNLQQYRDNIDQTYTPNDLADQLAPISGDLIKNRTSTDAGFSFLKENDGSYKSWDQLTPEQQHRIYNTGLFPNINLNTNCLESNLSQSNITSSLNNWLQTQAQGLGNTSQRESEGYLLNQGLPTLLQGIGALSQVPFFSLAGQAVNTANSLSNGNIGSALFNGIDMYNLAGNMANTANFNNVNPSAMGNEVYTQFNPSQFISRDLLGISNPTIGNYVGNAGVAGIRAGLDGGDIGEAVSNSLLRTGVGDIARSLGLNETMTGIVQQGLSYLYNRPTQTTASGTQNQQPTQPVSQQPQLQAPSPPQQYTLTNPLSIPTYSNPFAGVPSPYTPSYGQPMLADYTEDVDDESDTNNPYNTMVNYNGRGQNTYG